MSFDPFETRLHFLQLVRKLNASQASIQKVVSFAIKYGSRCGEDLWECVVEESSKVSRQLLPCSAKSPLSTFRLLRRLSVELM